MNDWRTIIRFKKANLALFLSVVGIAVIGLIAAEISMIAEGSPLPNTEVIAKRTLNSKTFDNGDGSFTLQAHTGHIHYLDKNTGTLENINTDLVKITGGWEMRKAGYELELPDASNGSIRFFKNKFDKNIYSVLQEEIPGLIGQTNFIEQKNADFTLSKIAGQDTAVVDGVKTANYQITYSEVAPNIDLVLSAGFNSFRKEVVIKQMPTFTGDFLEIEFQTNAPAIGKTKGVRFENNEINFRPAKAWDGVRKSIDIELDFQQGKMIKRIPRDFLENAAYPVITDTTASYTVGGGDGYVYKDDPSWDTAHDAASGDSYAYDSGATINYVFTEYDSSNNYAFSRTFFPTDTSALPDNADITSTTLSVYVDEKLNGDNDGDDWINVFQTFQASSTVLSNDDYDQNGDSIGYAPDGPYSIEGAARIDITNISTDWNTWTFNNSGRSWISKTGYTKVGMREGHDVRDLTYAGTAGTKNATYIRSFDYAGTTSDPYFEITYTTLFLTLEVRKSSNESATSTTSLDPDEELKLTLEADKTYTIEGAIFASSTSPIPDIVIYFNTPNTWITKIGFIAASDQFQHAEMLEGQFATSSAIGIAVNTATVIQISGTIKTGSAMDEIKLFWAQANSNSNPTVVREGSYLRADEI